MHSTLYSAAKRLSNHSQWIRSSLNGIQSAASRVATGARSRQAFITQHPQRLQVRLVHTGAYNTQVKPLQQQIGGGERSARGAGRWVLAITAAAVGVVAAAGIVDQGKDRLFGYADDGSAGKKRHGSDDDDLPVFTADDVKAHSTKKTGIWVSYDGYVYDITKFINRHPGGTKIREAAGSALEPYWQKYPSHLRSNSQAKRFLQSSPYIKCIGKLDTKSQEAAQAPPPQKSTVTDTEPERDPSLVTRQAHPCNAEPKGADLARSYLTPSNLFFVRNHGPVPVVDTNTFKLTIGRDIFEPLPEDLANAKRDGTGGDFSDEIFITGNEDQVAAGGESVSKDYTKLAEFTLEDLKTKFPKTEVDVTIICAGNRRGEMHQVQPTNGLLWDAGAASTARWGGVRLTDLVRALNTTPEEQRKSGVTDVIFVGVDDNFDSSVPAMKALNDDGDVIIAYEMNGEPIPRDHGYPLRVVVPGVVGVRNVKWLKSITLANHEARSPWQRGEQYKGFPPNAKDSTGIDVPSIPSIQSMPVQSVITLPEPGQVVETHACRDPILVNSGFSRCIDTNGWAYSGGGKGIVRIDVSSNGGKTWHTATKTAGPSAEAIRTNRAWAWTLWEREVLVDEAELKNNGNQLTLTAKAVDTDYNTQPESVTPIWNFRGLLNNSWHKVKVTVANSSSSSDTPASK